MEQQIGELILAGHLIPVAVFGTDKCCEHGDHIDCPSTGYGLCDRFSTHAPAGSDCNRADWFLLRPTDHAMNSYAVRLAVHKVLDEEHDRQKEPPSWRQEMESGGQNNAGDGDAAR